MSGQHSAADMNGVGTIKQVDCLVVPKINEPCLKQIHMLYERGREKEKGLKPSTVSNYINIKTGDQQGVSGGFTFMYLEERLDYDRKRISYDCRHDDIHPITPKKHLPGHCPA